MKKWGKEREKKKGKTMRFIAKQLTGWHKLNVSVCRCLARCNRSHVKCIHLKSFFFTMHFAHRRRPINDNSNFHKSASNTDRQMHKSFVFRPISIEKWIMHANFGWNETNTEWNLFAPSSPRTRLVRLFLIVTWKQTFFIFEQRRNGKRKIGAPDVEYFTMKKKKIASRQTTNQVIFGYSIECVVVLRHHARIKLPLCIWSMEPTVRSRTRQTKIAHCSTVGRHFSCTFVGNLFYSFLFTFQWKFSSHSSRIGKINRKIQNHSFPISFSLGWRT